MRRYSAAQARQRLSSILDAAERGDPVVIERRGVEFSVAARPGAARRRRTSPIAWVDPAVLEGNWTWTGTGKLRFRKRTRSKR